MTNQFQVGRTYATRSICDYDCILSFTILARTAKTVTTQVHGKAVRRGLSSGTASSSSSPSATTPCAPSSALTTSQHDRRSIARPHEQTWLDTSRTGQALGIHGETSGALPQGGQPHPSTLPPLREIPVRGLIAQPPHTVRKRTILITLEHQKD